VPFLAYVHAREPDQPEDDERASWEPDWRVWRWVVVAVVFGYAATRVGGVVELLLVMIVFAFSCRAAVEALTNGDGLREWRQ
jgi:hypothetical protein